MRIKHRNRKDKLFLIRYGQSEQNIFIQNKMPSLKNAFLSDNEKTVECNTLVYLSILSFFCFVGLIDYFTTLFFEVSAACFEGEDNGGDSKTVLSMLQTLLETLHGLFKYVSDFVRKALQVGHQVCVIWFFITVLLFNPDNLTHPPVFVLQYTYTNARGLG